MSRHCRHTLIKDLTAGWRKQRWHKLTPTTVVVKEKERWLRETDVRSLGGAGISASWVLRPISYKQWAIVVSTEKATMAMNHRRRLTPRKNSMWYSRPMAGGGKWCIKNSTSLTNKPARACFLSTNMSTSQFKPADWNCFDTSHGLLRHC